MPRLALAVCASILVWVAPLRAEDGVATLSAVTVQTGPRGATVRLDLTAPRQPQAHELQNPYRVYFDLPGTIVRGSALGPRTVGHPMLAGLRVGQFQKEPAIARIVLEVTGRPPVKVATADGGRTVFLGVGEGGGRPDRREAPPPTIDVRGARWVDQSALAAEYSLAVSGVVRVDDFFLSSPDRIVVDLEGAVLRCSPAAPSAANLIVAGVRMSQHDPRVVRCVFDLRQPAGYLVAVQRNPDEVRVRITVGGTSGRQVVIDPGHGGHDPGCRGVDGAIEKAVVLAVGLRVRERLRARGIGVALTREDDRFISLFERPAIATRLRADCFVSIHCNAMPTEKRGQRSGTEVYYHHDHSALLAGVMLESVTRSIGLEARGAHVSRLVVVREATVPSVLVELGYLDHAGDGEKLATPGFQDRCAEGITAGLIRFLERTPRQEPTRPPTVVARGRTEPDDEPEPTPVRPAGGGR